MITDNQIEAAAEAIWDAYRHSEPEELAEMATIAWPELRQFADAPDASKLIIEASEQFLEFARVALEAGEAAGSEWLPMSAFSGSDQPVQRWHKIHKAPITVRYAGSNGIVASNGEVLPWLEASGAHAWPDAAFTEHFRLLPTPPTEGDR